MNEFEKYLHQFALDILNGRLDLAVLKDKFIKGGLYEEKNDGQHNAFRCSDE